MSDIQKKKTARLDLNRWTYQEYNEFIRHFQAGNQEACFALVLKIIVAWDYDIDLAGEDPIGELSLDEGYELLRGVVKSVDTHLNAADESEVVVTMNWNMARYFEWERARRDGHSTKVEKMMREIAHIEGEPAIDEPLNATQGALIMKAVTKVYEKKVSGKR